MKRIMNMNVSNVKKSMMFILCLLFCIHYSFNMQAQSFAQMKNLAESGNVQAQFVLGNMYANGNGCLQDSQKAIYWYKKSIEGGNQRVLPHLALLYDNLQDYDKAYPLFLSFTESQESKKIDEKMYAWSLFFVGYYLLEGKGIQKNEEEAVVWLEKAKNYGMQMPYYVLGECYLKGVGIPKNPQKTFELYKEAHTKFKDRQEFAITLATCYLEGYGCSQNFGEVYSLIEHIADGTLCTVDDAWKCKAQLSLAVAYYKDNSVSNHYEKAVKWLTNIVENSKAIEIDKAAALYWLQRCYRFGRGVAKDVNKADELVKQYSGYDSDEPSLIELLEPKY